MEYEKPGKPEDLITLRKTVNKGGYSTSKIIGTPQSLMCFRNRDGIVNVENQRRYVGYYNKLAVIDIQAHVDTAKYTMNNLDVK